MSRQRMAARLFLILCLLITGCASQVADTSAQPVDPPPTSNQPGIICVAGALPDWHNWYADWITKDDQRAPHYLKTSTPGKYPATIELLISSPKGQSSFDTELIIEIARPGDAKARAAVRSYSDSRHEGWDGRATADRVEGFVYFDDSNEDVRKRKIRVWAVLAAHFGNEVRPISFGGEYTALK